MSRVNSDERKNSGTGDQGAYVTLKVKSKDGFEVFFRVESSTPLKKLLNTYCFRRSFRPNCVTFLFAGRLLRREQTPDELEMEDTDCILAILHPTEEHRVYFDDQIAKDMAREEEEEELVRNKIRRSVWRIISKLIAENSSLKEEVTKLRTDEDEEEDSLLMKIGRNVHELMAKGTVALEELKKELKVELTRLKEELMEVPKEKVTGLLKDIEEDDEEDEDEDDEGFIETGRFISHLIDWAKENQDVLRCTHSRL